MKAWEEDLLVRLDRARDQESVFAQILAAARALGFDCCAYGLRLPLPVASPKVFMINNYPLEWRERYEKAGYLFVDPTVSHCRRTQTMLVWSDAVFAEARAMWEEARAVGLRVGLAQSNFDSNGAVGMLTLSRSSTALTPGELRANEPKIRWLVTASHHALSHLLASKVDAGPKAPLTSREIEVLKWIADGRTSRETGDILHISIETVNFHVKNAVAKLQATNKTAAVVRAVMLGLLG